MNRGNVLAAFILWAGIPVILLIDITKIVMLRPVEVPLHLFLNGGVALILFLLGVLFYLRGLDSKEAQ